MNPATAFDGIAARYDETWTNSAVGRAQRDLVWRNIDPLFHPGDRILDIGCGTGEDAAHFTARGVSVDAIDASPAMIEIARSRGGFPASVLRVEDLAEMDGRYDGAISNFGALNCVENLSTVADRLAALVRPGGSVAICIIGRFCAWETLYYASHFQFRKAVRRVFAYRRSSAFICGQNVFYPTVSDLRDAFAPHFEMQSWTGVGLFVPPSYVRLPEPVVGFLGVLDGVLARVPVLRALADHRLCIFVRSAGRSAGVARKSACSTVSE